MNKTLKSLFGSFVLMIFASVSLIGQNSDLVNKEEAKQILKERLNISSDKFEIKFIENVVNEINSNLSLVAVLDRNEQKIRSRYSEVSDDMRDEIEFLLKKN